MFFYIYTMNIGLFSRNKSIAKQTGFDSPKIQNVLQ